MNNHNTQCTECGSIDIEIIKDPITKQKWLNCNDCKVMTNYDDKKFASKTQTVLCNGTDAKNFGVASGDRHLLSPPTQENNTKNSKKILDSQQSNNHAHTKKYEKNIKKVKKMTQKNEISTELKEKLENGIKVAITGNGVFLETPEKQKYFMNKATLKQKLEIADQRQEKGSTFPVRAVALPQTQMVTA